MKKSKLLAALLIAVTMTSCGENDTSSETETADTSITSVSETTEASTVNTETNEETAVTTSEEKIVTSEETTVTTAETTYFVPANAMELNVDNLLLTIEGWVYNNGIRDESACYFFCILDDGTVYTMKYKTSESDTAYENAFTKKLYSCDNSVWDMAENVKAVGNFFSQMNYEMLMENFTSINWDSDYYERPYDEVVPAVDPVYAFITYLYPLKDGKKTAVFAEADGRHILDDNAAEFLRGVAYSNVYKDWTWQLWHFSKGDYGAEFKIYTDEQELYEAGAEEIYYSKDYPDIVSRIVGNYSTFKIFDGDGLYSIEQVKNFIGCKSAFDEFKRKGSHNFEQVYRGVPVYDGRVTLTVNSEGYPTVLRSSYVPNIDLDVIPKQSEDVVYKSLEEMDIVEAYVDIMLYIIQKSPENSEPALAYCVTVNVMETTWNGAWYEAETEKLYCFDANTGEFLREYTLSIPN